MHLGMSKIVINHLDKLFVTSDSNTIITELDVFHPAAKLIVMAAKAQQQEIGDGTNTVISDGVEMSEWGLGHFIGWGVADVGRGTVARRFACFRSG